MATDELILAFPNPLLGLIRACETECVAACCGIDAYAFEVPNAETFFRTQNADCPRAVLGQIEELSCLLSTHEGVVSTVGEDVNAWSQSPAYLLALLDKWRRLVFDTMKAIDGRLPYEPAWLHANAGAVLALARSVQADQAFALLPILADALADAGCPDEALLDHCRRDHVSATSCWVVEMLLDEQAG